MTKNNSINENYYILKINSNRNITIMGLWKWLMPTLPVINNYNNDSQKVGKNQKIFKTKAKKGGKIRK